jgi:O-acetyl-ADP-ribose deacetylase (regulator of RNase III)
MIATVAKDELRLWDLCGQQVAQWNANQNKILRVCFSPDGERIATAGWNGTIRLWDLSGRQLVQWNPYPGEVTSMSFSPDGKCIAVVGGDSTVQLWQVEGLNELLARGCGWLKDYFVTHPEALDKLDVYHNPINSLEAGRNLAGMDDVEDSAIAISTAVARQRLVSTVSNEAGEGFLGEFLVHDKLVRIYQGDITNLVTDVIVSSDDTYLKMKGALHRRIQEVGGDEIYSEAINLVPLSLGNVAVTTAGKLQAKKIFHGVVIDWRSGVLPSHEIIRQVVHTCMKTANQYRFQTIAFPLLATGAARFPTELAWKTILQQISKDLSQENQNILEVIIALYGRRIVEKLKINSFLERLEKVGRQTFL